jgi:orotate phosphoribosyltransferase
VNEPGESSTRDALRDLLRSRAVMRGEFVLSSGKRSSFYLDARLVTLSAEGSRLVADSFMEALHGSGADSVAGLTMGADPIVASIAALSSQNGRPLDGLIVRKEAKQHGAARRIEGPWREGRSVAVVDDTLTTGASALEACRAVEDAGGTVVGVFTLIDREQGAAKAIEAAGYPFTAIFTADELL